MKLKKEFIQDKNIKYACLFTIILIMVFLGDIIAINFIKWKENPHDIEFQTGDKKDYNRYQIPNITELNAEQIEQKITTKESFYLLLVRESCYTCNEYVPLLSEVFKDNNITNIYYLNRGKYTENNETFKYLNKKYKNMKYTPYLMYFKNGNLIKELIGKKNNEELEKWLKI